MTDLARMQPETKRGPKPLKPLAWVLGLGILAAGCSEPEVILPGLREDLRSPGYDVTDPGAVADATARATEAGARFANTTRPANLGAPRAVAAWPQRGANPAHDLPNAAFSPAPQLVWSTKAGDGNSRRFRISAEPVSDGARVFTMDSRTNVIAHALGGGPLWATDITPPGERPGSNGGGGLALAGGTLYVTSSYGELVALDAATGAVKWRQALNAGIQGAPTVSGGKVFVAAANSVAYAISTDTGRVLWRKAGVPTQQGSTGVAAPAISGNTVVYPLANRSLLGLDVGSGEVRWVSRVAGGRAGAARAVLRDFTGEPVIEGGVVYAATSAGRAVAVGLSDGQTRWSADEGAQGTMAVAGGSVYFVNDQARLVRLSTRDGTKVWEVPLPRYTKPDKPRRLKAIFPAYGPIMAGGRLWVASGDGLVRSFNPADGSQLGAVALPAGAASRPITVAGMMLMMTERGDLVGLR